jgi:hypothetical protein
LTGAPAQGYSYSINLLNTCLERINGQQGFQG